MKKLLIIYPHFPPSNLAGVHRPRLFAQHLPSFGWCPVVLTVHEDHYEEAPDHNLVKLLPADLRIEKVSAYPLTRPRLVGDIGLRAFRQLYKKAKQLIRQEKFDFLYIPIPSFYCALLGRRLHAATGIPYGIDYIDPWVHEFPGSEKFMSRHWFSSLLAKLLEPIAVKKASLITGVAAGYYQGTLERNPYLKQKAVTGAMPYGGEEKDHELLQQMKTVPYLFEHKPGKLQMIYAGAMLPKAYVLLEAIFKSISSNKEKFNDVEFHFIGTGKTPDDANGFNIKDLAIQYDLWQQVIFEYPQRIPYFDVLVHLDASNGVFILGSTEPHYTPSKAYQAVLSEKPVFAVLHSASTAVEMLRSASAGLVLDFNGEEDVKMIEEIFLIIFDKYRHFNRSFQPTQVDKKIFDQYSAKSVTRQLAELLNKATL